MTREREKATQRERGQIIGKDSKSTQYKKPDTINNFTYTILNYCTDKMLLHLINVTTVNSRTYIIYHASGLLLPASYMLLWIKEEVGKTPLSDRKSVV